MNNIITKLTGAISKPGWNKLFLYIICSVAIYLSLLVFNYDLHVIGTDYFTTHARRFMDSMLLSLPVLWISRRWIITIYMVFVALFILSQIWYYRTYYTIMPFSSYLMVNNLNGLGDSIANSMKWKDILVLIPLAIVVAYAWWTKPEPVKIKFKTISTGLVVMLAVLVTVPSYALNDKTKMEHPYTLFTYYPGRAYRQFGFVQAAIYQINHFSQIGSEELDILNNYMTDKQKKSGKLTEIVTKEESAISKKKNLIMILAESMESWPIGQSYNGVEITPNLNRIVSLDSTLFVKKVLPQVKDGRTSDGEILLNTGLLPLRSGATTSRYATNEFLSLPKALKKEGYRAEALICGDAPYWNNEALLSSLGYESIHDELDRGCEGQHMDEFLYKRSLPILKEMKQPFVAMLLTMSGHDPIATGMENCYGTEKFPSDLVKNYLILTHYIDKCLGDFISSLEKEGLLQNSMVVITGDHDYMKLVSLDGREEKELTDRFIPFIVMNSPISLKDVDGIIGESDIYPTLLDLIGLENYEWRGLGNSILRPHPQGAVYHDGSKIGNLTVEEYNSLLNNWQMSDLLIRSNWFSKQ